MKYWARISEDDRKQPLQEHLQGVARRTSEALSDRWQQVGYYAGLWHDLGKYVREWQDYLQNNGKKRPHAAHGAMLALMQADDPDFIPALAYAIAGHHTGLPNCEKLESENWENQAKGWETASRAAQEEIKDFIPIDLPDINLPNLRREFAIRMLFSALVDSDRLDAAQFEYTSKNSGELRVGLNHHLPSHFDPHLLPKPTSEIDRLRNVFASDCIANATQSKGLYRLTGVCGIGKTQSSLRWGIIHANTHQMRGILYVAPLKVIIEQTAKVYRKLLGDDNVLEHHSSYEPDPKEVRNYKLDTERWDKPYIVTSGVQFYESLFSNRPGQCRKLHQLRDRVILIDEAQTIPLHLAIPILDVLETLVEDWGCSVVLMSATQPAFDRLKLCDRATDLIPQVRITEQFRQLQRVTYRNQSNKTWTWTDLAKDIQQSRHSQNLVVVNTTKLAREGFRELSDRYPGDTFHLSTRMCVAHRKQVLDEIERRLDPQTPRGCYLVSTQLIEAGVNVDFPRVYRQLAPFDSIIQTAGRCNRNQRLQKEDAIATIFNLADSSAPPDYRKRIQITKTVFDNYADPLGEDILDAIREYFQKLYNDLHAGGQEIQKFRYRYDFPKVAKRFHVIEDDYAASVVVPWGEGDRLIETLSQKDGLTQTDWRSIQPYVATVPKKYLEDQYSEIEVFANGLAIWTGNYDSEVGCLTD